MKNSISKSQNTIRLATIFTMMLLVLFDFSVFAQFNPLEESTEGLEDSGDNVLEIINWVGVVLCFIDLIFIWMALKGGGENKAGKIIAGVGALVVIGIGLGIANNNL